MKSPFKSKTLQGIAVTLPVPPWLRPLPSSLTPLLLILVSA